MNLNDLIIFEMANSHQGSVGHGINIIRAMGKIARKYNVRAAVKLQYREIDSFIHPDFREREDIKHIPRFMQTKLCYEQFCELVDAIKAEGMTAMSTPFDEKGVEWCMDQGLEIIKIASCSAMDWPLMEKAVLAGKPLIVSTGGKTIQDIDKIYNFLVHRGAEFAFCHCLAEYPAPPERIQLDFMDRIARRYPGVLVGYSGHEDPDDTAIPMMAVAKGAAIMERHVGLPTDTVRLNAYSMNPDQADKWVGAIVQARKICTMQKDGDKYISNAEIESLRSLQRGVYVNCDIRKGEKLRRENVFFAMPCAEGQLTSGEFREGIAAGKDYRTNDGVYEYPEQTSVNFARSVIHEAKGLLYEAGIALGDNFEVELSHHYGIQHFRQYGAIIVSIINREYCKKLIIVLSGQKHPNHFHKVKEETFQLLYGDLRVSMDGNERIMKPGDIQTILRGQVHAFTSVRGAVFEEVSTTHIKGDSYYEDPKIQQCDLMERKTIIRDW